MVRGQEALLVHSPRIMGCVTIRYQHSVKSVPSLDTRSNTENFAVLFLCILHPIAGLVFLPA